MRRFNVQGSGFICELFPFCFLLFAFLRVQGWDNKSLFQLFSNLLFGIWFFFWRFVDLEIWNLFVICYLTLSGFKAGMIKVSFNFSLTQIMYIKKNDFQKNLFAYFRVFRGKILNRFQGRNDEVLSG